MSRPPIVDPRAVPVVGIDDHLAPVPTGALAEASLRARFQHPPSWVPEILGDPGPLTRPPAAASVLIPLVLQRQQLTVLLTRRTDHLRQHAGQISFPGGRADEGDADAVATALRELHEELGIGAPYTEVIGQLPVYTTVTSFVVTPVVAFVHPGFELVPQAHEVAEAFEVPLAFLMDPANHRRHRFEAAGHSRQFLSMPWTGALADGSLREYFIWGATAAMLRNLYRFLSA